MLTTTFTLLRKARVLPETEYRKLAKTLGGITKYGRNKPIPLLTILEINSLVDCILALQAIPKDQAATRNRIARHFACDCAQRVLPIWLEQFPDDIRPQQAIDVARRYADGNATAEELSVAEAAAKDASWLPVEPATDIMERAHMDVASEFAVKSIKWSAAPSATDAAFRTARYAPDAATLFAGRSSAWHATQTAQEGTNSP